jgi:hypothetical protein
MWDLRTHVTAVSAASSPVLDCGQERDRQPSNRVEIVHLLPRVQGFKVRIMLAQALLTEA